MARFIYSVKSAAKSPKFNHCCYCGKHFKEGDPIDVCMEPPKDDKNFNKMVEGKPFITEAVFCHEEC